MAASPTDRIMSEVPPSQSDIYTSQRWRYDVFLSFRGEDTRKKFTGHLYQALRDAGINAFRDDDSLERGEDISSALIRAIQSSRISVLVFSTNYAGSRWCLQELTEIMDCRKSSGQMVLPIFYDVDPSDVRHQTGTFAEAFVQHEKRYMSEEGSATIKQWKAALTEAANLSGWDLRAVANGYEANFVKEIVWKISNELKHKHLDVAKYPIGLDSRLARLHEILNVGSKAVHFVGICGIGGVGKTTLAKAVYNEFSHTFEAKCFLADVREISERPDGLLHLQERLLYDILKLEEVKLGNVHRGISVIKERLRSRTVLVVLDNLSHLEQLRTLAGGPEWFGPGSRIIMTTRNLDLLKEVEAVPYMAPELTYDESLELFSLHAFRNRHPKEEYIGLSRAIVSYSNGLPLALEVLGSFLCGRSQAEWESAIEKLKEIPNNSIQAQLRISYDALGDDNEKSLFLDIACFFVGWNRDYVVKILNARGLFPDIGLSILTERCLLGRDPCRLSMHDLLRDMGREIVREESPVNPSKRSRLWFYKDALATLTNSQGGEEVEGIILDSPARDELKVNAEAFARMTRLRLLQLNNVTLRGDYALISKELRWLCWHNFPSNFISRDFYLGNLVMLDMQKSKLRVLWRDEEVLGNLKFMNLSHSHLLRKTPNFLKLPNLEELILEDCVGLVEVHQSIGYLQRLVLLNLKDCRKLKNIPDSICKVKSLQILNISGCSEINSLPEDIGEMISLRKFLADGTSITQVPSSITCLKDLTDLSLCGCKVSKTKNLAGFSSIFSPISSWLSSRLAPSISQSSMLISSVSGLTSLKILRLSDCNLSDDAIPVGLERLVFLKELDLSKNYFSHLPDSISRIRNLSSLTLDDCVRLKAISHLPPRLKSLSARNCPLLEMIASVSNRTELELSYCNRLQAISGVDNWSTSDIVNVNECGVSRNLRRCKSLSTKYKKLLIKDTLQHGMEYRWFPGSEIPPLFSYQGEGPSQSFRLPPNLLAKPHVPTIVCVVYGPKEEENTCPRFISFGIDARNGKESLCNWGMSYGHIPHPPDEDHMWVTRISCRRVSGSIDCKDIEVEVTESDMEECT